MMIHTHSLYRRGLPPTCLKFSKKTLISTLSRVSVKPIYH